MRGFDLNSGRGVLKIKNTSGSPYTIEETGQTLAAGEEVDLLNPELPSFYSDWDSANRLVTELTSAKLYQDIQEGDIQVIENRPPVGLPHV